MKSSLAWCLLIAVAASSVSAGGADQPPKRSKYTCAQIRDALSGSRRPRNTHFRPR